MRLKLLPACKQGYHGPTGGWLPGDEKEVAEPEASRLLSTFPQWFEAAADDTAPRAHEGTQSPSVVPAAVEARKTKPAQGKRK